MAKIPATEENLFRFASASQEGRDSRMGEVLTIWEGRLPILALAAVILGVTELLLQMGIVRKLDFAVNSGIDQFKIGSEWGMTTPSTRRIAGYIIYPRILALTLYRASISGNRAGSILEICK